jgi:DNA-binding GntR family transcriptional regulator
MPVLTFDRDLHRTILGASRYGRLQDIMTTINDYVSLFRSISATTTTHRGHTAVHDEILTAVERGDREAATRAMTEHLTVAKRQTLRDFTRGHLLKK